MSNPPDGFSAAQFDTTFLDLSGPYFLKEEAGHTLVGMRVAENHVNYLDIAHGGVLTTFADVGLSYQVHASETPRLAVVTNTLTTNFLAGAKLGDWLVAECRVDRIGKRIAYTSGSIRRGEDVIMTMTGVFTILRKG
ncbi:PaaI family thioesterase [Parerythrobacter jejuensis]|uniref:Hotdog fold thioesterase n=1 Tax=Parerythrobacter jejuensis TaxID=795812 RepID=A0A845AQ75_9SPHN|nr:PaaI family thioesterase [Parerythrobacter jejuensis]MXP30242.1 hotdog fold thioesterase [Parerythrobacter jejuensis]MXP33002.1 hotdog fold thioesterase [Parerythrobacter jejuensis]